MKGGRLLGEGAYGCTFKPAPTCEDGRTFTTISGLPAVGKLALDTDDELRVGKAIMGLPRAADFFALPSQSCKPKMPITDAEASQCEVLQESEDYYTSVTDSLETAQFKLLIMPDGGYTFDRWSENLPLVASNFISVFKHLLEGMVLYQSAGYVHHDIHGGNVLVDSLNIPRYIDFGLAFRPTDVTTLESIRITREFNPAKIAHPPEIFVWKMMNSNKESGRRVSDIIADGVNRLKHTSDLFRLADNILPGRESADVALTRYAIETEEDRRRNNMRNIALRYGSGFDVWRLGHMMWRLWHKLLQWSWFSTYPLSRKSDKLRKIFSGMLEFHPEKRLSAKEVLTYFA